MGKPYILKLIHQVDDKLHGRSNGHYALVTPHNLITCMLHLLEEVSTFTLPLLFFLQGKKQIYYV